MSRRKQRNPRQFKRHSASAANSGLLENELMELEDRECEEKENLNDEETTLNQETQFPLVSEKFHVKSEDNSIAGDVGGNQEAQKEVSEGHNGKNPSGSTVSKEWDGPRELEMVGVGTEKTVCSRQALLSGTTWGPFTGKIERCTEGNDIVPLGLTGGPRWLNNVRWVSAEDSKNNCVVYSKGGHVWCSTTRGVIEGEELVACAVDISSRLSSLHILPQQAAMASILPNAVINTFKPEETSPGGSLKCTICDYTADSLMALQPHILTHLSQTGLRCTECHFTFQTPRDLSKHQELHRHSGLDNKSTNHNQTEHSESLNITSPKDYKSTVESAVHPNTAQENCEQLQRVSKAEAGSGIKAGFSYSRVKSEPSSPRLASSPIQNHMAPEFSIPPFLPHVPFSQDTQVPQASEILVKMSELVHRRLNHGGTSFPPVMYNTLVPKGATCFECNITFSNLDNYLVHKKHYCNGRWQHMSKSHDYSISDKTAANSNTGGGLASMLNVNHSFEVKGHNPMQFSTSLAESFSSVENAPEEFPVSGKKASIPCNLVESPNGITLDSKSPKMSESGQDNSQTTCEACKITFGRHENYMVHKQYYCASRHEPPLKRAAQNNKQVQKSFRTRKRRKMPSPGPVVSQSYPISSSFMIQDTVKSLKDVLHHLVPKRPEPSLTVTKSALVSKCKTAAHEEGETPIDLSKKCTMQFGKVSRFMDYHECAICKISFNKVEDYLSHKQNFCPGAVLENNRPSIKDEGSKNINAPNNLNIEGSTQTVSSCASAEKHLSIKEEHNLMNSDNYPGDAKKIRTDEQIWPYYEIKAADYATGILVPQNERRQSPNEGSEGEKEQPMPDGSHVGSENVENPAIKSLNSSLQGDKMLRNESCSTSTPDIHFMACSQDDAIKPKESISSLPASKTEEMSSSKRGTNGSISAAVNSKYCRPCDIQFNNLSNFITHKKFYCSAHTAEHVK